MKQPAICALAVVACLAFFSVAGAQIPSDIRREAPPGVRPEIPTGTGKPISEILPRQVCKAIETYLAAIDVAKSDKDRNRRQQKYDQARVQLEAVLKPYGKEALLMKAVQYASYAEAEVSKDATDPELNEIIEKRLKLRGELLELCTEFTISR